MKISNFIFKFFSVAMLAAALAGCAVKSDDTDDTVYITITEGTIGRTVQPDVQTTDLQKIKLTAKKDDQTDVIFENKAIKEITNKKYELNRGAGEYTFELSGTINEMTYSAKVEKDIVVGNNEISFTLKLVNMDETVEGKGSIYVIINMDADKTTKKVEPSLKGNNSDCSYWFDAPFDDGKFILNENDIPVGEYELKLEYFMDEDENIMTGMYKDTVYISNGLKSTAELTIEGLDKVKAINYELNGGNFAPGFELDITQKLFTIYTDVCLPIAYDVEKDGYDFDGWYDNKDFSGVAYNGWNASEAPKSDITLYAKWIEKPKVDIKVNIGKNDIELNVSSIENGKVKVTASEGFTGYKWEINNIVDEKKDGLKEIELDMSDGMRYSVFVTAKDSAGRKYSAYKTIASD